MSTDSFTNTDFDADSNTNANANADADADGGDTGTSDTDDDSNNVNSTILPTYTLDVAVSSDLDDVEERSDGEVDWTSSDLELVVDGSTVQTVGLRFQEVSIPTGAIVASAHIQFTADETHIDATNLILRGEKAPNSAAFSSDDFNVTSRSTTDAFVSWQPAAWSTGDSGAAQKSPNLSNLIQEIIDQPDWSMDNSLSILIAGDGKRVADSFDGNASSSAVLHIEYQSSKPPPSIKVTRGPYLQLGTTSSMVVRWRTDVNGDSTVFYGTDSANLRLSNTVSGSRKEHEVSITGLAADTRYYYSIQTGGEDLTSNISDSWFRTNPAVGTNDPLRVWVIGDSGTANSSALSVYNGYKTFAGSIHTNLWLMLGDNAYPDGTDAEYQRAVYDIYPELLARSVVWSTLGNHDARSASSRTQSGVFFDMFTLPSNGEAGGEPSGTEAYYSFDYGNVHFICLNSEDVDRDNNSEMMNWLRDDLENNSQTWTIAFWHHPPYTKGSHDSDTESRLTQMRETALPILESRGVDLVLTGHSHSYERSFLVDGHYDKSSTLDDSMILNGGDGRSGGDGAYQKQFPNLANNGAVYSVVGSSGKTSSGPLDHPIMIYSKSELGSLVLDFDDKSLTGQFLDKTGAVKDDFTIEKQ